MTKFLPIRKLLKMALAFSFLTSSIVLTSVNAVEVDLTAFAGGGDSSLEETHTHSLVQKYDSESHWNECLLCCTKFDEAPHSSTVKYTIAENTCNVSNKRVTYCSQCTYSVSEKHVTLEHTLGSSLTSISSKYTSSGLQIPYLCYNCTVCNAYTDISSTSYWEDGTEIDWESITVEDLPIRAYHPNGKYRNITSLGTDVGGEKIPTLESSAVIDRENSLIHIHAVADVSSPECSFSEGFSDEYLTSSNINILLTHRSYVNGSNTLKVINVPLVYDAVNKTYTVDVDMSLRDWSKDYTEKIAIGIIIRRYDYNSSRTASVMYQYSFDCPWYLPTNFEDPSITSFDAL